MVKRAKTANESKSESAAGPKKPGGALRILTFLLAAYGAVMATMAYSRGGSGGSGGSKDAGKDALEARLATQASAIRSEVKEDLYAGIKLAREQCSAEAKKAAIEAANAQKVSEAIVGKAEAAAQNSATRSEELESKVEEATKETTQLKEIVATISADVREFKSRPVGVSPAPAPREPVPVKPAEPVPGPGEPVPPAGPTPEDIARNKAKVRELIGDLSSPDIGKVFNACTMLGKLGDLEAVPPLIKVSKELKDALVRSAALGALGALHSCDAMPTILAAMTEKDPGVFLMAGRAFTQISGLDSLLNGDATKKERNDAKEKWSKWWKEHETEMRAKWHQPVEGAPPPAAPVAPPPPDAGMGDGGMDDGAK